MATEAKGAYGTLQVGQGYLVQQTAIDPETAAEAVAYADDEIDRYFRAFERTSWTDGHPREITRCWLRFATAEYLERVHAVGNPEVSEDRLHVRLRAEAKAQAEEILSAGGPQVNGEIQGPEDAEGAAAADSVEIWVT